MDIIHNHGLRDLSSTVSFPWIYHALFEIMLEIENIH